MNPTLGELLNCCRFCLNQFKPGEIAVVIDETIKNYFLDLTGMDLVDEPESYSNIICELCNIKMSEFVQFRNELFECQKYLYESKKYIVENESDVRNEIIEISFYDKIEKDGPKQPEMKKCNVCGKSFAASGLYNHMKRAHYNGKCLQCDVCGKLYNLKNDLIAHIKRHSSRESRSQYPCSYCESVLLSKSALHKHFDTFHSEVVEIHPCDYDNCHKSFKSQSKLLQHKTTVHKVGEFTCEHCNKFYSTKHYLQRHMKQCHTPKVFENCEICQKSFPKGSQFKKHIMTHEKRQFECVYESCEKKFQSKSSVLKHIQSKHEPLVISCQHCGLSFPTPRHLNRHISRQHNENKAECEVQGCKMLFGRKDYLTSHYKTHKDIDEVTKQTLIERVKNIKTIPW